MLSYFLPMNKKKLLKQYQKEVDKIVDLIVKNYQPERIIHFGSLAMGKLTRDSDIDLCILKELANPAFKEKRSLWRLLWDHGYDFKIEPDLHLYDTKNFNQRLKAGDPFIEEIIKGKVIYEEKRV